MFRGVILGALAFAGAFAANKQLGAVGKDIARYDKIRAMSGDPPFLKQQAGQLLGQLRAQGTLRPQAGRGMVSALIDDLMRYARIRSM